MHVYSEDAQSMYLEVDPATHGLPEFSRRFPSVPLWTDTAVRAGARVTATGCECGLLVVTRLSLDNLDSLVSWEKQFHGPLTCTKLFSVTPDPLTPPPCLNLVTSPRAETDSSLHLCVSHSLGQTEVFRDILHSSLADSCSLPESDSSDIVTCICVADVGMAGRQSLVLGTYGHQILCYDHTEAEAAWSLAWRRSLSAPVLSVRCEDLTGDGVRELIVVTTRGVQVLQLQLDNVKEVAIQRLKKLVQHKQALASSNSPK